MKILVTGGLGFVGVHVARHLAAAGHDVTVLDRETPLAVHEDFLGDVRTRVQMVQADLADPGDMWETRLPELDAVVHAAAVTPLVPGTELDLAGAAVAVNVAGTVRVLDLARRRGIARLVHVSTGSVYGIPDVERIDEDRPLAPVTIYGITKAAADQMAQHYGEVGACEVVVARLAQPYGPMERTTGSRAALSPVHDWAVAAIAGDHLCFSAGDLDLGRDYVYVGDVADAVARLATQDRLEHRVYNVSNGERTTLRSVFERIVARVGDTGVGDGRVNLSSAMERPVLSPDRLHRDAGWKASTDLDQGVAATVAWLRTLRPSPARTRN
ncbi:MAG: SDR family NAD(P)-dependent oxidoreductase [Propionibacteriales bacterium]|nr:SDR family NAD(P)-dependent oxidoreductase [Propionibacteriales bacterium]